MILASHNIARWIVLIFGLTAGFRSYMGLSAQKEWTELDQRWGLFFTISMDIQLLLGLLLYFLLSPITRNAFGHFHLALQNRDQRFFVLIHGLYILLAILFTHLGSILPQKADTALVKHQRAATFFTLAVLCIFMGMPWTRPFFPGF